MKRTKKDRIGFDIWVIHRFKLLLSTKTFKACYFFIYFRFLLLMVCKSYYSDYKLRQALLQSATSIITLCNKYVKSLGKPEFRNKIKQILLNTLELENDHIEVSHLINQFSKLS